MLICWFSVCKYFALHAKATKRRTLTWKDLAAIVPLGQDSCYKGAQQALTLSLSLSTSLSVFPSASRSSSNSTFLACALAAAWMRAILARHLLQLPFPSRGSGRAGCAVACCILRSVCLILRACLCVCVSNCNYTKLLSIAGRMLEIYDYATHCIPQITDTHILYWTCIKVAPLPPWQFPPPTPLLALFPFLNEFHFQFATRRPSLLKRYLLQFAALLINGNLCIMLHPFVQHPHDPRHKPCPTLPYASYGPSTRCGNLQMENQIKGVSF